MAIEFRQLDRQLHDAVADNHNYQIQPAFAESGLIPVTYRFRLRSGTYHSANASHAADSSQPRARPSTGSVLNRSAGLFEFCLASVLELAFPFCSRSHLPSHAFGKCSLTFHIAAGIDAGEPAGHGKLSANRTYAGANNDTWILSRMYDGVRTSLLRPRTRFASDRR